MKKIETIAKNLIDNAIATAENTADAVFPPLEKVNFSAVKTPIYLRNTIGDYVPVPTETGQAIIRTDNNIPLGVMKKRYAIADNSELDIAVREGLEDSLPKDALQNIKLIEKTADNGSVCRWGYDVKREKYGYLMALGVIDPVKVTRQALQNAVSVASTILSTNAIVTMARTYGDGE